VPAVLAAATGSDWNAGGSILTFYFPIGLFIVVAAILYLQFTRPHTVPGHKPFTPARPSATAATGVAAAAQGAAPDGPAHDSQQATGADDAHEPPAAGS
jgi:hypothetical protein